MAALLRSARVLRFSASHLLQAKGANSHGQRICRFYSRAAGGRGIGVCIRQIFSGPFSVNSLSPCSSAWARLGMRYYGMAAEQEVVAQDEPSLTIHTRQAKQFEWALAKLDSSIRRTGRISTTLLHRLFDDVCRTGCPTVNQALLLLRSCGSLLPELSLAERTKLAHHMWDKLQQLGAVYDVSHYNALLKVYLQNEFEFSPTEFLAKMEEANVQPNRVTYQRLIAAYCQVGDVEGASKILGFMKSKDLPITEAVFNSLLVGHSRAGDMDSAVNILSVMRGVGVEPGLETYQALLTAYAEKGDLGKIKETLDMLKNTDITLMDRDLLQVVVGLAKAGHQQHMLEILEHLPHDRTFLPAAINLCLGLITQNHEDTAFALLKTFPIAQTNSQDGDTPDLGNFFLRHCVNMNKSPEKLVAFCKELRDSNLHTTPLQFTLFCALEANNTALVTGLMKMMKEEGIPLRPHYFWPLLSQHQKVQNITGVLDVLKAMTELSVLPDTDTYSYYVFPTFPSVESACSALKDIGLIVDSNVFESSVLQVEASSGNLSRLFDLLSSSSLPDIDLGAFRGPLIAGFKKSNDVENMVNITELLSKDRRFTQTDPDIAATVICQLFYSMSEKDVHAKVETLREYLHQLQKRGVTIPGSVYSRIRAILHSCHLPELIKDVFALRQKDVKSGDADSKSTASLEKTLEELKSQGISGDSAQAQMVFKEVIRALCDEENLSRALELKAEHEDKMSTSCYALLINLCCNQDNPEEALNLKRELARKDSEARLDGNKYMNLVRVLCNHNQLEDALDLLKEMKEMGVVVEDATVTRFFYTLNDAAKKGQVSIIRPLQETAFTLGLIKPSIRLCSPLLTAYLKNEDLAGALQAAVECHKQYNLMCRIHDILCALVEKGDTELLEKAMDFLNQVQGEMNMLYNLFFAFLQTGHYKEARKIIETPGLRAKPVRLQWYAEKCIANQQMEALETMVDFTAKLFECDRDEMYHYLLRLCKQTNDWHKADGIWMKMQEENVIPRERTMRLLADILKSNNQVVPFKMSEMWYEEPEAKREPSEVKRADRSAPSVLEESPSDCSLKLKALVKKRKFQEAYSFLEDADRNGVTLNFDSYDILIRALLSSGNFEDAMAVKDIATSRIEGFQMSSMATSLYIITLAKRDRPQDALTSLKTMLQEDQVPSQMALRQLFRCLGRHGDTKSIQELEGLFKKLGSSLDLSGVIHNNMVLSYIANGNVAAAVESLESLYTQGSDSSKTHISYIFRYVLEENSEACDKLFAMAERLCNHFASYTAAMDLFLVYVDMDKIEEARDLLQRCAALAEQTDDLMGYVAKVSKKAGQTAKIKKLCELIPDLLQKDTTYTYLMKCHAQDNDLASAKALYQRMQVEGLQINNLSLKRLAQLYSKAGEIAPFTEPPNSFTYYAEELKDSMLQRPEEA